MIQSTAYIIGISLLLVIFCSSNSVSSNSNVIASTASPQGASTPTVTHTRRIRYNGKYPKNYGLKYKELRGDSDVISKVILKGSTPAGRHLSIMVDECMLHLGLTNTTTATSTTPKIYIDCTLGHGGHSIEIINRLPNNSYLYGIDRDYDELMKTKDRVNSHIASSLGDKVINFIPIHGNFKNLYNISKEHNILHRVDGILLDLGYSSMQVDNPARGFTYKSNGPLDMRMNQNDNSTKTAYELLQSIKRPKVLSKLITDNSDEPLALPLSHTILQAPIPSTTIELYNRIKECLISNASKNKLNKPEQDDIKSVTARVMQSLRIEINKEFDALNNVLVSLPTVLSDNGGRAVVLTFHSGEDRPVKLSFRQLFREGVYKDWSTDVVLPTYTERMMNSRSKCCKLRWCVKK